MELPHRGNQFVEFAHEMENDLRDLMNLPPSYHVLILPGGARGQFAGVPLNLTTDREWAAYLITGMWGQMAAREAEKYTRVKVIANSEDSGFTKIPHHSQWQDFEGAAYLHYTENETVQGVEFADVPNSADIPLICDMSSNILSKPLEVTQFGLIYAGGQKNLGIAGVTLVIIREDLAARQAQKWTPSILNYAIQIKHKSMYNTPPVFPWYVMGLTFKWIKQQGGVAELARRNLHKSQKLYQFIDQHDFYINPVDSSCRSRMNVIFTLKDPQKEALFLQQAEQAGLTGLKGHKSLGGFRASIYNAMPESGVDALIAFMKTFSERYGC
jgi:phosphoserine aminotransferase